MLQERVRQRATTKSSHRRRYRGSYPASPGRGAKSTLKDADAVTRDLLRKKRKRQLGHREHVRLYRDAWKGVMAALALAVPPQ